METLKNILFIFLLLFTLSGHSEEKAGAPATEVSQGEREYREKLVKLTSYETKVSELESQFEGLVKLKSEAKTKAEALHAIEQMKEVKKERDQYVEKFNDIRDDLNYRYPDKGKTVMRRYAPLQKKSVQQLEKRSTLDADLSNAKKTADKVYRPFVQKAEEEEQKKQEALIKQQASSPSESNQENQQKRLRIER